MSEIGSIRVAMTTNDLVRVDTSFAGARQIVVYEVGARHAQFMDCFQFRGPGGGSGKGRNDGHCWKLEEGVDAAAKDLNQEKLDALKDCAMLFSLGLGDVHALTVKAKGVFPVKMERVREIPDVIEFVQRMVGNRNPPLWMRRALGGQRGPVDYSDQYA